MKLEIISIATFYALVAYNFGAVALPQIGTGPTYFCNGTVRTLYYTYPSLSYMVSRTLAQRDIAAVDRF